MEEEGSAVASVTAAKARSARWSLKNCILARGLFVCCLGCSGGCGVLLKNWRILMIQHHCANVPRYLYLLRAGPNTVLSRPGYFLGLDTF
jgi:hypothetical protein